MKVRPLLPVAVTAARRTLASADVQHAREIHVEVIAARHGAMVVYGPLSTARACIVRAGRQAIVCVDERARGKPPARFTIAHELGHHVLHGLVDHFEQCAGEEASPRRGHAWHVEREANDFATELLIPESLGKPMCGAERPTLDDVERLSRAFRTSPEMSAIRYVQLTDAPCAAVLVANGKVKWAAESAAFPAKIVRGRLLAAGREIGMAQESMAMPTATLSWLVPNRSRR